MRNCSGSARIVVLMVSKPAKAGALAYGDGPVAAALLVIARILVTYIAVRRGRRGEPWAAETPAWAVKIAE
ncbi:MAG: hypothetical protein QOJ80_5575 [Mycobacterium sp.]|jgi:hypothetical protein|nr:hypothetical protein [Mycobacterium sp.]